MAEKSLHLDIGSFGSDKVCYVLLPERLKDSEQEWLREMTLLCEANIVVVSGLDWERDLTPWKVPGLKKGEFGDGAAAFLEFFEKKMLQIESSLGVSSPQRAVVGVSLSGLFALWASCQAALFSAVGSVSGSMWYEGFVEHFASVRHNAERYYFSLGEAEKNGKNQRLARVDECTRLIMSSLESEGKNVFFEYNPGNHFGPLIERIQKAIINLYRYEI